MDAAIASEAAIASGMPLLAPAAAELAAVRQQQHRSDPSEGTSGKIRFVVYSQMIQDKLKVLLRKEFERRWDEKYPHVKWSTLSAPERGQLCWAGSECTVPISAKITRWDKGTATVVDGEDLPNQLRGGDYVLVEGIKLRLVPKSNSAVSKTKLLFALSKEDLGLLPSAPCENILMQAVKSFESNVDAKMKRSFETKVKSGDEGTWDISLLTAMLVNSNHRFLRSPSEIDIIAKIRQARNGLAHATECQTTQVTYDAGVELINSFCSEVMQDPHELAKFGESLADMWAQEHSNLSSLLDNYTFDPKEKKKEALLGEGTFGKTYRMKAKTDGGLFAVKIVNIERAKNLNIKLEDMQRETHTMQALNHKNVIRYWATCLYEHEDEDRDLIREYCMVMELAPGGTLAQLIVKGEPLKEARVRKLTQQMASALHHLHVDDPVILHRDLKPANVLLSAGGDVKICDLGLACIVVSVASMTRGAGTGVYSSEEKATGKHYGPADDIWALGCICFELVTLQLTAALSPVGLWCAHDKVPGVVEAVRVAQPAFADAVRLMLTRDPAGRPSAQQVEGLLEGSGTEVAAAVMLQFERAEVNPDRSTFGRAPASFTASRTARLAALKAEIDRVACGAAVASAASKSTRLRSNGCIASAWALAEERRRRSLLRAGRRERGAL
jgi:hypothetical protein